MFPPCRMPSLPMMYSLSWRKWEHPHSSCTLLPALGLAYQKARFVSDHLDAATRLAWWQQPWPPGLRRARHRQALRRFGDEASFAPWGSLRATWARKGPPPAGLTSGIHKVYTVFGLLDSLVGRWFSKAPTGRFDSES